MAAILVVEERPVSRSALIALLQSRGHTVRSASDEKEALQLVRTEKPDLVFIDILTPAFNGCEFVKKMRKDASLVALQVLFQAPAHLETEARAAAKALGAGFVAKQASPAMLFDAVETALAGQPSGVLAALEPSPSDTFPSAIARRLQEHASELAGLNAQLRRQLAERSTQLEVARTALDREIEKRLWAEHELTQTNLRLRDQAIRDELTGLYNRRYLEVSLVREESRARRSGQPFGLVIADVDNFKAFNDRFGHAAGDVVLKSTARYIASAARGEDIVSRYGGDEFVLVMSRASRDILLDRAEALRSGVSRLEIEYEGRQIGPVTLSAGTGLFPDHGESGQAVLRVADNALYLAKRAGRNCVMMVSAGEGQSRERGDAGLEARDS